MSQQKLLPVVLLFGWAAVFSSCNGRNQPKAIVSANIPEAQQTTKSQPVAVSSDSAYG
jgi:hypothetical protein